MSAPGGEGVAGGAYGGVARVRGTCAASHRDRYGADWPPEAWPQGLQAVDGGRHTSDPESAAGASLAAAGGHEASLRSLAHVDLGASAHDPSALSQRRGTFAAPRCACGGRGCAERPLSFALLAVQLRDTVATLVAGRPR